MNVIRTIEWVDGRVLLIDQTALPLEGRIIECRTADEIAAAITGMAIRGAPAIGVAAAFGLALWAQESSAADAGEFLDGLDEAAAMLAATRPTAKNLTWALDRMTGLARANREASTSELRQLLIDEAIEIADEDLERNQAIGLAGEHLIGDDARVLTHCNAGSLATAGYGTALAPIFAAHSMGRALSVWAGETRPLLQGARLTAWEDRKSVV